MVDQHGFDLGVAQSVQAAAHLHARSRTRVHRNFLGLCRVRLPLPSLRFRSFLAIRFRSFGLGAKVRRTFGHFTTNSVQTYGTGLLHTSLPPPSHVIMTCERGRATSQWSSGTIATSCCTMHRLECATRHCGDERQCDVEHGTNLKTLLQRWVWCWQDRGHKTHPAVFGGTNN